MFAVHLQLGVKYFVWYLFSSILIREKLIRPLETIPNQNLLVQSQQWKHQNNVQNLFKVNRKTPEQRHFYC